MAKLVIATLLSFCIPAISLAQKPLLSYDDIKYLLHNNLHYADTFLMAKGFLIVKSDEKKKVRKYTATLPDNNYDNVEMRSDGKRLFIEIETNDLNQYNLIRESIVQYLNKESTLADIQSYAVKDLGDIYISINDTVPYSPIKKDYDIHIVGDKNITAYN